MAGSDHIAAVANAATYDHTDAEKYAEQAPHIKHADLRALYRKLAAEVYARARKNTPQPHVLDLGAGDGAATLPFLELGARVTAVEVSGRNVERLTERSGAYSESLTIDQSEVDQAVARFLAEGARFDVVVACSFLHHVPSYLSLVQDSSELLGDAGVFFSFQDPLRYDSLGTVTRAYTGAVYLLWRLTQGDLLSGSLRRLRRLRGVYLEDSAEDNAEYHVVRQGVDAQAIGEALTKNAFEVTIVPYFATQARLGHALGRSMSMANMFAIIAERVRRADQLRQA